MKYRGQKSGGTVSFNPQQKWMELQEQLHDIFDPVVFMILLYDIQYDTTQCRLYTVFASAVFDFGLCHTAQSPLFCKYLHGNKIICKIVLAC